MATFSNKDYSGPFSSKYEEDEALSGNRGNQARHMATQARHSQGLTGSGRIDTSAFGRNRDVFGNDQYEKATDNPLNSLIRFANRPQTNFSQSSGAQMATNQFRPEMLEEQAPANPTQSGLGSFLNRFGQDVQMGLSNILSGGAFQNDPNEQINRLVERGYSLSDAADFVNSTQRTMEQNNIQRALYGDTSDPSSSVLSGDEGTGLGDIVMDGTGDGGTGDEGTGVPSSTDFRFFGGYNPVSRSDVLVPSTFRQDIRRPDARLDPVFPQRPDGGDYRPLPIDRTDPIFREQPSDRGFDFGAPANVGDTYFDPELNTTYEYTEKPNGRGGTYQGWDIVSGTGGTVGLFGAQPENKISAGIMADPQMPGPGQFSTMQELMDYQQQFPSLNLMGEYKRLRNDPNYRGDGTNFGMIENNSYRPSGNPLINRDMFAQGGVDRLFGNEQAPPYMYQGIMS